METENVEFRLTSGLSQRSESSRTQTDKSSSDFDKKDQDLFFFFDGRSYIYHLKFTNIFHFAITNSIMDKTYPMVYQSK